MMLVLVGKCILHLDGLLMLKIQKVYLMKLILLIVLMNKKRQRIAAFHNILIRINREYAEAAEKRKAERRTFPMPDFRPGDPAAAYYAHLENIRRHLMKTIPAWTP